MDNQPQSGQPSKRLTALIIAGAYIFSCAIKYAWIFLVKNLSVVYWNGQLIPNTADALYWGSLVQKALYGLHGHNILLNSGLWDMQGALPALTYALIKYLSFSIESIMLYAPIFISSLIVIPIILIGRLYKNIWWGLASGLLVASSWGFYMRTMAGYFDTDMFILPILSLALYFLLAAIEKRNLLYLLGAMLLIILSPFIYQSMTPMIGAMIICWLFYILVWRVKFPLNKTTYFSLAIIAILLIITAIILPNRVGIANLLNHYVNRPTPTSGLQFISSLNNVTEAGAMSFNDFAKRVSGSIVGLIIAIIGCVVLIKKKPMFLIAIPLIGLSLLSFKAGVRFALFATPIAGLGATYLIFYLIERFKEKISWLNNKWWRAFIVVIATTGLLAPNILLIKRYMPAPVLTRNQVLALDYLKSTANPDDFAITWWDYGSAAWFYGNVRSIASPNAQNGGALFTLAEILTTDSQRETANLSRWLVENFKVHPWNFLSAETAEGRAPAQFIAKAKTTSFVLPTKTTDAYLFLPLDILKSLSTINRFSNVDLLTGQPLRQPNYIWSANYNIADMRAQIPEQQMVVDFKNLTLSRGNNPFPVKAFHIIYNDNGKLTIKNITKDTTADLHVVLARDAHLLIIADDRLFNSSAMQMILFRNYDSALFEPIMLNNEVALYKLKI